MDDIVLETAPLGFPWVTVDPFLFCVHHDDAYPAGNDALGPAASLAGRTLGQDFSGQDGWRMYHGETVPGFPQHPHRGFETVTVVRRGFIDHSDSLGATARFGKGDVQWLTAGKGILHCEMFPLLEKNEPNPVELFQIWLNLPQADKMVEPHFAMLWEPDLPRIVITDDAGVRSDVTVVAGRIAGHAPPPPPPRSWAAREDSDVAIWCVRMDPRGKCTLPAARDANTVRTLYFFRGTSLRVGTRTLTEPCAAVVRADFAAGLQAGDTETEVLVLQGRPIAEPVVQYGPFVMNTREEVERAMKDYRATRFGGWPWPKDDPVHAREETRFAKHADGRLVRPRDRNSDPPNSGQK